MDRREALRRTAAVTGLAISSSISIGFLKGCTPSGKPTWPPIFLKKDEILLISSIADTILPTTNTVGALDVHIPEFIDLMLRDSMASVEKTSFRASMKAFMKSVDEDYDDLFEDSSEDDKIKIMQALDDPLDTKYSNDIKSNFYLVVKQLTILGFYTSENVMKNMLDYHPVPGRYEGCIPLGNDGKVYVDNNV